MFFVRCPESLSIFFQEFCGVRIPVRDVGNACRFRKTVCFQAGFLCFFLRYEIPLRKIRMDFSWAVEIHPVDVWRPRNSGTGFRSKSLERSDRSVQRTEGSRLCRATSCEAGWRHPLLCPFFSVTRRQQIG